MSRLIVGIRHPRLVVIAALVVVAGLTALASAQFGAVQPGPPRHLEFLHQEVPANTITTTLNDFDKQGWEIFQVIPVWVIKNENADTTLVPKSYEVFGRRPAPPK